MDFYLFPEGNWKLPSEKNYTSRYNFGSSASREMFVSPYTTLLMEKCLINNALLGIDPVFD